MSSLGLKYSKSNFFKYENKILSVKSWLLNTQMYNWILGKIL
jgi:hypothetical protein